MYRRLNLRLLCLALGSLAVLAVAVHFVHGFQVRRTAASLRRQAERAAAQNQFDRAVTWFSHYLAHAPGDSDAFVAYALALDRASASPAGRFEAFLVMEQGLRRDPARHDLRRRAVQTAIDLGRFADAVRHLKPLLAAFPDKGDLEEQLGWCLDANGDYAEAAAALARAAKKAPQRLETYIGLAAVLRHRLDQVDEADQAMDEMVQANPRDHRAFLFRARHRRERGDLENAARDVRRAAELAPADADVLLAAAEVSRTAGKADDARRDLKRGLERHPRDDRLYRALADLELRAGDRGAAIACLRRGVELLPDPGDLLPFLADLLIDEGRPEEARGLTARLRREGKLPAAADYLAARALMQAGRWAEARDLLDRARTHLGVPTKWAAHLELCLAQCWERFGETDLQLAAYHRAVALAPGLAATRVGLGATLLAAGNVDEAAVELRAAASGPAPPADVWPLLGRALMLRVLRAPERDRDWREVHAVLQRAEKELRDHAAVVVLRADVTAAKGEADDALALLERARAGRPREVEYWTALADLAARHGRGVLARDALQRARKELGDIFEVRLAEVRRAGAAGGIQARRMLRRLEREPRDRFSAEEQLRLVRVLAEAFHQAGGRDEAERLWRQLAGLNPRDLRSRLLLLDLAVQEGRNDAARALLAEVRRVEGEDGVLWRAAEAGWLIQRAWRGDRGELADARRRTAEVKARRGDWSRVPLLEAALDDLEGRPDAAAKNYLKALELGERSSVTAARAARLLSASRRFAEADQAVRAAEERGPLSAELARLGADAALANQNAGRALALARQAVSARSRDYRDHLWLAHILEAAGQQDEAETVLRQAVAVAGRIPDARVALVRHLVRAGKAAKAEAAVEDARRGLADERGVLALARCEEAVGRPERAEALYRQALTARPTDFIALRAVAEFHARADRYDQAAPHLRKLIDPATRAPDESVQRARRDLAVALAAADAGSFAEALALLDDNARERGKNADDDVARAFVLAAQPARRLEALGLLKGLAGKQGLPPEDLFLLALAYDLAGETAQAAEVLSGLAAPGDAPQYLAHHVRVLIRGGDLEAARSQLERLERLDRRSPRTQALRTALSRAEG